MSPSDNATCPERDQLVQFLLGHLTEPELEAVERHLSACAVCGDTLHELNAVDTLVEFARSARADLPEAEMVESLIARVRKLPAGLASGSGVSPGTADGSADERAEGIRCLFRPPEQPDELGRLAEYRVLGHLGTGGMGVVFEAEDEQLKRTVALKVLPPSLGPGARGRFLQEARAAAAIDHDNVVTIYQVGEDRGLAFLAMQRLEGETLESLVKRDGTLPADRIVEIGKQLALGLRAAHAEGLIHRDVKPANIWMEAGRARVKLLDFGVARILDDEPQLTESGMVVGTPAYMSPEQAVGERSDERSDLFSLGCVLYRLATGRLPFQGANALAMLRAIQTSHPQPPEELNPDVPRPLAELVMSLLEKEPDRRPQSADVVVEALQQIAEGGGQLSLPPPAASRKKARTVRRWGVAVAALVLLGVLGYSAAPTVVRIVMNQGQLVIESTDPNVKIEVLEGGQIARVVDLRTEQSIDLTAGEYGIKVAGEAGGWSLSAERITLTRGGKETIKVWREPGAVATGQRDLAQDALSASGAPTYDGKPFEHWLAQFKSERNPEHLAQAVHAMAALADEESAGEAARAVFSSMRVHGSFEIDNSPRGMLAQASLEALWQMPADAVLPAMLDEITAGNDRSHAFTGWMFLRPWADPGDHFEEGMRRLAGETVSTLLALSRDESNSTSARALDLLGLFCIATQIDPAEIEGLIPRFQEELSGRDTSMVLAVSHTLIKSAPDSQGLVDALVRALSDEDARNLHSAIVDLGRLGSRAAPAVPTLVDLLTECLKPQPWDAGWERRTVDTFGWPSRRGIAVSKNIRVELIHTLGEIGPGAKAALPLLEEIVAMNVGGEKHFAENAISQIEAAGSTPSTDELAPTPGGMDGVEVWREPSGAASGQGNLAEDALADSKAETYDGRTLEECLAQLKSERNPERLARAVRAVTVLGNEESDEEAARAIFRSMRVFGSNAIDSSPRGKLIEASQEALWRMRADAVIPAMLEEISAGNDNSRAFMIWMTARPGIAYDGPRFDDFADEMRKRAGEIASALLTLSRDDSKGTKEWALQFLSHFCRHNGIDLARIEGVIARFQEELPSHDVSVVLAISPTLITSAPDSPGLVDSLVHALSDEKSSDENPQNRYSATQNLRQLGSRAAPAVPKLVNLLTEYLEPLPPTALGPAYMVHNLEPRGGVMTSPDLRVVIIQTLGTIGPGAKAALPLLEEVRAKYSSDLGTYAEEAIAKIEAAGQNDM